MMSGQASDSHRSWLAVIAVLAASAAAGVTYAAVRRPHAAQPAAGPRIEMTWFPPAAASLVAAVEPAPREPIAPVTGLISFDSRLRSTIYIDGRSFGATPLPDVELAPGFHHVRAVSRAGTRWFRIHIVSGRIAPDRQVVW